MIGDWVYESKSTQFPMKVVSIGEDYCYLDFPENEGDVFDGNEAVPILLNRLDFRFFKGFEKEKKGIFSRFDSAYIKKVPNVGYMEIVVEKENISLLMNGFKIKKIQYVHELQHAHRLLFGKELEIKL